MATLLDYPAPDYGPSRLPAWANKALKDDSGTTVQVRAGRTSPLQRIKLAWSARTGAALVAFSVALRALRGGFVDCYFYTPSFWEWWADVPAGTGTGNSIVFPFGGRSTQATPAPVVKVGGAVQTGNYTIAASGDSLARDQVTFDPVTTFTDLGTVLAGASAISVLTDLGSGVVLAFANTAHWIKSTNYGATWADLGYLGGVAPLCTCSLGSGVVLHGRQHTDGLFRSTDFGTNWTNLDLLTQLGYEVDVYSLAFAGSGVVLAGGYRPSGTPGGKILRSTDNGVTWTDLNEADAATNITAMISLGGGILLAGSDTDGRILRSTNSGATWTSLGTACVGEIQVSSFADLGGGVVIAGTTQHAHLLRSDDYGATWMDIGSQVGADTGDVPAIASLGSGVAIAAVNNGTDGVGSIALSQDSGATWTDLGQQFSQTSIASVAAAGAGIGLAGTSPNGKIIRLPMGPVGAVTVSFAGRRLLLGRLISDEGPWGTPDYQQAGLSIEARGRGGLAVANVPRPHITQGQPPPPPPAKPPVTPAQPRTTIPDLATRSSRSQSLEVTDTQEGRIAPLCYGRCRFATKITHFDIQGTYIEMLVLIGEGEIDAVEAVYVDDTECYAAVKSWASVQARLGTLAQTAVTNITNATVKSMTHPGMAYASIKLNLATAPLNGGIPHVEVVVRGRKVYGPTAGTTAWSENPVDAVLDAMRSADYGAAVADATIDMAGSIAAAEAICDTTVAGEDQYRVSIVIADRQPVEDVAKAILQTCNGRLGRWDGQYRMTLDGSAAGSLVLSDLQSPAPDIPILRDSLSCGRSDAEVPNTVCFIAGVADADPKTARRGGDGGGAADAAATAGDDCNFVGQD